jgi:hypothetical protein
MSKADVKAKEAEAIAARNRFMATLHEVQHRLSPKTIAADVKETVKTKADGAMSAAKDGVTQAATHPSTVAAVTIPVLVYLFRKPIARGLSAIFPRKSELEPQVQPFEAEWAPAIEAQPTTTKKAGPRTAALTEQGA